MTLRRSALWAVGDSALASLATFVVGLYATRVLSLVELGAYGVMFIATFVLSSATTTQLYFTPIEVDLVEREPDAQLGALAPSVVRSVPITVPIGVLGTAIGLVVVPELSGSDGLALGLGALGVAIASPTQDHVRRMLHQAGHSAAAMGVSAVQVVAASVCLVLLTITDLAPIGLPLAALTVANVTSLVVGLVLARLSRRSSVVAPPTMPLWSVIRLGRWLLLSTQAEQLSGFAAIAILSHVAGAVAVGQYEAARVLAQPLFVLSTGMLSVFRPRVMVATRQLDRVAVVRYSRAFVAAMSVSGIVVTLAFGVPWAGNPLPRFFPNAFEEPGVYATLLVASTIAFCTPIFAVQAIAADRARRLVMLAGASSLVYAGLTAVLARPLGPLAVPIASIGSTVVWLHRFRPLFRSIFATADPVATSVASSEVNT